MVVTDLKTVFFDIGNTLLFPPPESVRRRLSSLLNLNEKQTKRAGRLIMTHPASDPETLGDALVELLRDADSAIVRDALHRLWIEFARPLSEMPGATALIRLIKAEGFTVGIVSNIWHPAYEAFRCSCPDIVTLVDFEVLSYRIGHKKPSREIYRKAVQQSGSPAHRTAMVGDSYELDMAPAMQTGMKTVWILNSPERETSNIVGLLRGEKIRPDWIVESLDEVMALFA